MDHGSTEARDPAIVLSRPYQLSSAARADEAVPVLDASEDLATSRLFARMAVRGLSGEQLYASLRGVGLAAEEAPIGRFRPVANTPRAAFLERFAGQEERPAEAQTSILQALALMNGGLCRGRPASRKGRRSRRSPRCRTSTRRAGRGALPRDPEPAAHARRVGPPGQLSQARRAGQGPRRPSRMCSGPCSTARNST